MTVQSPDDQKAMDELVTLKFIVLGALGFLGSGGALGVFWLRGVSWLVEHQVLVSASSGPVFSFPGAEGAGLDMPRVLIIASVAVALIAIAISSLQRALTNRRRYR